MMEIKLPRRVSEILKTTVENRHGEKLVTIQDFIVGVDGRLKYAILSHGGFLGIGDVLIPIPFDALMAGGEKGTVVLDIDKETLEKSLNFESKTWPDFTSAESEEKIDRYFAGLCGWRKSAATRGWECLPWYYAWWADLRKGVGYVGRTTNRRFDKGRLGCA